MLIDAKLLREIRDRLRDEDVALADLDDATQEVAIRAWRSTATVSFPAAWLRTVCRREAIDRSRANGRRQAVARRAEAQGPRSAEPPDPADSIEPVLAGLASHQRSVVECLLEGLDVRETAVVLGIPAGTVKSRRSAARHALARLLRDRGWHLPDPRAG
ncbi:MAG: RNA polymerase sigma factor [Acidimicrobiales bacterium]